MQSSEFMGKAKELVALGLERISVEEIHIVWYSWILGNQKALLTTPGNSDGLYFEVTFNKDKNEFYVDRYKKQSNVCVPNWEA